MSPRTLRIDQQRIKEIQQADQIFYWSIKYQKLMLQSKNEFEAGQECELCIGVYRAESCPKQCDLKFDTVEKYRSHLLHCEKKFKRQLIWLKQSDVPKNVRRVRELGDLSSFETDPILKIVFDSITLVNHRSNLIKYLTENGCLCNNTGSKCKVQLNFTRALFNHISCLEKRHRKYIMFKANLNDMSEKDLKELSSKKKLKLTPLAPLRHNRNRLSISQRSSKASNLQSFPNSNCASELNIKNQLCYYSQSTKHLRLANGLLESNTITTNLPTGTSSNLSSKNINLISTINKVAKIPNESDYKSSTLKGKKLKKATFAKQLMIEGKLVEICIRN